jgi:outer membrane usher protein
MLRSISFGLAVACAVVASLQVARAAQPDVAAAVSNERQRAFANLVVDGVDRGQTIVWLEGSDILLPLGDAERAGLPTPVASKRTVDSASYVSLRSLAPDVAFAFDPSNFALRVSITPTLLATERIDVSKSPGPDADASRPPSAFTNYLISAGSGGDSALLETGLTSRDSLFYSNESIGDDGFSRGDTYFAHDDALHDRRLQAGDVTVSGDPLLGDIDLLGAGAARLFEIDPYVYRYPAPAISGVISTPGTAEVYVNGLLASSIPLQPGTFDLNQIPVQSGLNDVAIVVRDAAGNTHTYQQSYFSTDALLRKGLTDYDYGAGLLRDGEGTDRYGNPALAASYRVGVSDDATLGARIVATAQGREVEGVSDVRFGAAVLHVAEALSDSAAAWGSATDLGLSFTARTAAISAGVTSDGSSFRTLSATTIGASASRLSSHFTASKRLGTATLAFSHVRQTFVAGPAQSTDALTYASNFGRNGQLSIDAARTRSGDLAPQTSLQVSMTTRVGNRSTLTASQTAGTEHGAGFEYREAAVSSDAGFGYDARYDGTGASSEQVSLVGHTPIADVSAFAQSIGGSAPSISLAVAGSIAAVDGHVMWSRPVGDAYALVESGSVGGVPVFIDGRPVGRTNANGLLLVPSLGAYASNRVSLDVSGLPLGVDLARGEAYVAPGHRGGSVASFDVERLTYFVGTVLLGSASTTTVPVDGVLTLEARGHEVASTLDENGRFYFENLKPGRYRATVRFEGRQCAYDLDVPRASGVANALGERTCWL